MMKKNLMVVLVTFLALGSTICAANPVVDGSSQPLGLHWSPGGL